MQLDWARVGLQGPWSGVEAKSTWPLLLTASLHVLLRGTSIDITALVLSILPTLFPSLSVSHLKYPYLLLQAGRHQIPG